MRASSTPGRRIAAGALLAAALLLAAGAPLLDTLRTWSGESAACGFRQRHGIDCLGCGGTRAFRAAAAGRVGAAFERNPVGAMAALVLWATLLSALAALATGRVVSLIWTSVAGVCLLAATLVVHAVVWWRTLPPEVLLR